MTASVASAEMELLVAVARACVSRSPESPVPAPEIDWERFFSLATANGLRPHACQYLGEACPARWRARFEANAQQNLALTGELVRVLGLLGGEGIEAAPFKGPALAVQAYGDLALRECADLDLFVRPADVLRAKRLLLASGYRVFPALAPRHERAFLRAGCEFNFENAAGTCLDLHWQAAPANFCIRLPEAVWRNLRRLDVGGASLPGFAPEDLLVLLGLHGAKHLWRKLIWICDLAALARMPALDWDAALKRAEEMHAARMLLLGLCLAAELLQAPLPAEIAQRAGELRRSVPRVREDLERGADALLVSAADHRFLLGLRERPLDKARYVLHLAFTPAVADWETMELPAVLARFYVFIRLGRLLRKFLAPRRGGLRPRGMTG